MKKIITTLLVFAFAISFTFANNNPYLTDSKFDYRSYKKSSSKMQIGLKTGYKNGFSLNADFTLSHFAQDFPLALRLGLGYARVNPGNAADARKIFINNATNGTPEKKGWFYDGKIDFLYETEIIKSSQTYFYAGVRHARFTGNFNYIGGNEDFDVLVNPWGIGVGAELNYTISSKLLLTFNAGADYYFPAAMDGHGTIYRPDNENVNSRKDYQYSDADKAIGQPKFVLKALAGITYVL